MLLDNDTIRIQQARHNAVSLGLYYVANETPSALATRIYSLTRGMGASEIECYNLARRMRAVHNRAVRRYPHDQTAQAYAVWSRFNGYRLGIAQIVLVG